MPLMLALAALGLVGFWAYSSFAGGSPIGAAGPGSGPPPAGVPSPPFDLTYPGADAWQSNPTYVRAYQGALTYLAWKTSNPSWDPGGIDGTYGPDTAAAVSAFEGSHGLAVDGEAGQAVATALLAAIATTQAAGLFAGRGDDLMGSRQFPGRGNDMMGSRQFPGYANDLVGTRNAPGRDDDHVGAVELVGRAVGGAIGAVAHAGTRLFPGRDDDHVGAGASAGWKWKSAASAPAKLQAAMRATLSAMSQDFEVPFGVSTHTINGSLVRVQKMPTGQTVAVSYCAAA